MTFETDNFEYEDWEAKISAYLKDTMPLQDRLDFEKNMSENPSLKEAVEFDKALNQQAQAHLLFKHLTPHLEDFIAENKLDEQQSSPLPKSPRYPLSIKTILGGLSLVLLLVLGILSIFTYQKDKKYTQIIHKWTMADPLPYIGNDTLFQNNATSEAVKAYQRGDYKQAEMFFLQNDSPEKDQQNARLYRAVTALLTQPPNTDKAIQILEVRYGDKRRFGYEAIEWYLALAYLQKKDNEKALKVLNNIPKDSDYTQKAQSLMQELLQNGF